jgi:hypothetical protein
MWIFGLRGGLFISRGLGWFGGFGVWRLGQGGVDYSAPLRFCSGFVRLNGGDFWGRG